MQDRPSGEIIGPQPLAVVFRKTDGLPGFQRDVSSVRCGCWWHDGSWRPQLTRKNGKYIFAPAED